MRGKPVFVDTNVWVYLYSNDPKAVAARTAIDKQFTSVVISTQVIGELFNTLTRKGLRSKDESRLIIADLVATFTVVDITTPIAVNAMEISSRLGFSYWDSLIVSTALACGCNQLLSEDLHHGQHIDRKLTVVNPFSNR
jgi:predicted nucleic acid-binding protein